MTITATFTISQPTSVPVPPKMEKARIHNFSDILQVNVLGQPTESQLGQFEDHLRQLGATVDGTDAGACALRQLRDLIEHEGRHPLLDFDSHKRAGLPTLTAPADCTDQMRAAIDVVANLSPSAKGVMPAQAHMTTAPITYAEILNSHLNNSLFNSFDDRPPLSSHLSKVIDYWMGANGTAASAAWEAIRHKARSNGDTEGISAFQRYFERLIQTHVASKPGLRKKVAQWLEDAAHPARAAFRQSVFECCRVGTQSCLDNVLLTWNRLTMLALNDNAESGRYAGRLDMLYAVALSTFRMRELGNVARTKVASLQHINSVREKQHVQPLAVDGAEIRLGLEIALRDTLNLPIDIDQMLYPQLAQLSQNDVRQAAATIREIETKDFPSYLVLDCKPFMAEIARRTSPDAFQRASERSAQAARAGNARDKQYAAWLPVVNQALSGAGLKSLPSFS